MLFVNCVNHLIEKKNGKQLRSPVSSPWDLAILASNWHQYMSYTKS